MAILQHVLLLAVVISCWSIAVKGERDGEVVDSLVQKGVDGLFPVKEASRHGRVKRQALTTLFGDQQQMVLDALNNLRSSVGTTNGNPEARDMEQLQWSPELQLIVNDIAGMCTLAALDPSVTANIGGMPFTPLGEIKMNLVLTGTLGVNNYLDQINTWGAQGNTYSHPSTTTADEYRQIITADAMYVACALIACTEFDGTPLTVTHQLRCIFNVPVSSTMAPYTDGTPCTACSPTTSSCCVENLCAEGVCTSTTSTTMATTSTTEPSTTTTVPTTTTTVPSTTTTVPTTTTTPEPTTTTPEPTTTTPEPTTTTPEPTTTTPEPTTTTPEPTTTTPMGSTTTVTGTTPTATTPDTTVSQSAPPSTTPDDTSTTAMPDVSTDTPTMATTTQPSAALSTAAIAGIAAASVLALVLLALAAIGLCLACSRAAAFGSAGAFAGPFGAGAVSPYGPGAIYGSGGGAYGGYGGGGGGGGGIYGGRGGVYGGYGGNSGYGQCVPGRRGGGGIRFPGKPLMLRYLGRHYHS